MRAVIQRVKRAHVEAASKVIGRIHEGMVVFVSVAKDDTRKDAEYLVQKIVQLRIFEDAQGKMNRSAVETGAQFLVVSQFTLHGDCTKGRRPSFDQAADPIKGEELYNYFVERLRGQNVKVETGQFRAMMEVSLVNDGPVTFILESK